MADDVLLEDSLKEFGSEKENDKMTTVAKKEPTQVDLTKQLDKILDDLRSLIKKRSERIDKLRKEIEDLENQNTELDGKINAILSDI